MKEKIINSEKVDNSFNNYDDSKLENIPFSEFKDIKVLESHYKPINLNEIDVSLNYVVFSGIGNPENFKFTLKQNNLKILKFFSFPDHYDYNNYEIDNIKKYANKNNSKIITTEKDYLRIDKQLRNDISYIEMDLEIVDENKFLQFCEVPLV